MPELPDIVVYLSRLESRVVGKKLVAIRLRSPFVLRSVSPPTRDAEGRRVEALRRIGKRIVLVLEGDLFLVVHLMIAGRLRWKERGAKLPARLGLAAFDFETGTLLLTEAGSKKRASLHVVAGERALASMDRGGIEVLEADLDTFREALVRENHTLKRALTDPRLFSGIGNAYSDEILHRAKLSPMRLTRKMKDEEIARLWKATGDTLRAWIDRLDRETGTGFPANVTAFRDGMAVHGRFGEACPDCGAAIQRIVYAENEANYCARCQTGGKLLSDRALSRLLRGDWPRTLDEMEDRRSGARDPR